MFALSVNIDGLRPWEFWAMDAEEHTMITDLKAAFHGERDAVKHDLARQRGASANGAPKRR